MAELRVDEEEMRNDASEGLEELLDYERQRQCELSATPPATPPRVIASTAPPQRAASSSAPVEWERQMQERALRADHLYRLGYQRAQEADKRAQEAKRRFEEEKARFRAQIEERRREAERLQQLANQKRLEAQEARRRAQEQKEIGMLEARRALLLLDRATDDEHSVHSSGNFDTLQSSLPPPESQSPEVSTTPAPSSLTASHLYEKSNLTSPLPPLALSTGLLTTNAPPPQENHAAMRLQTVNRDSIDDLANSLTELKRRDDERPPTESDSLVETENAAESDGEEEESEITATIVSVRLGELDAATHATPLDFPVSPRPYPSPRRHDMPKAKKLPVDIDEAQRRGVVVITRDKTIKYAPRVNQRLGTPWTSSTPEHTSPPHDDSISSSLSTSPDASSDLLLAPIVPPSPDVDYPDSDPAVQRVVAKTTLDAVLSGKARSSSDLGDLMRLNIANKPREPQPVSTSSPRSTAPSLPPQSSTSDSSPRNGPTPPIVLKKKSLEDIGNKKAHKSPSLPSVSKKEVVDREDPGRKKRLKSLKSPLSSLFGKDKERESHTYHKDKDKEKDREKNNSHE